MDDTTSTKQATIIARTLAILATVLGVYLIVHWIIVPFAITFHTLRRASYTISMFVPSLPVLAFGSYCIFTAYCLWRQTSSKNIRRISFSASVMLFFLLVGLLQVGIWRNNDSLSRLATPLLMVPAGIFYIFFNRLLLRLLILPTTTDWTQREKSAKSAKRYFGWFAFFSFIAVFGLFAGLSENKELGTSLPEVIWVLAGFLGSIILAFAIYKLGVAIALRNKPKDTSTKSDANESGANGTATIT